MVAPPSAIDRASLRRRLLADREAFAATPQAAPANAALAAELTAVLRTLEPEVLGLYWPMRSEFNAVAALAADNAGRGQPLALPYAHREPRALDYRRWHTAEPTQRDDFGIPTSDGAVVVPDVVLVPCVGFTADGFRLGYGGGFFDRWLAAHPSTTAVGVAWTLCALAPDDFTAMAHDRPLTLVVTEQGVVS